MTCSKSMTDPVTQRYYKKYAKVDLEEKEFSDATASANRALIGFGTSPKAIPRVIPSALRNSCTSSSRAMLSTR